MEYSGKHPPETWVRLPRQIPVRFCDITEPESNNNMNNMEARMWGFEGN